MLQSHLPNFNLKRSSEDCCDTCVALKTQLKDTSLSDEEKDSIKDALKNHGDLARSLRNFMSIAIQKWKRTVVAPSSFASASASASSSSGDDDDVDEAVIVDEAVLRFSLFKVDDAPPGADWHPKSPGTVDLMCQDFGGGLVIPHFGEERPSRDYFVSNLKLQVKVIANIGADINTVMVWDDRGQGKDIDAMGSARLRYELKRRDGKPLGTDRLFQIMDNCVGQNKSQALFMLYALLSITLYPMGIALLFLLPGHSHMACDRVVSWLRASIKGVNLFSPEDFLKRFNSIKSVEAEFLDHREAGRTMFIGFEALLHAHFVPLPAVTGGGYTKYYFFEFLQGVLTIRKSPDTEIIHTHDYVQASKNSVNVDRDVLVANCKKSIESKLFLRGRTFAEATLADIRVVSASDTTPAHQLCLRRNPGRSLTAEQMTSLAKKYFSIPKAFLHYFPIIVPTDVSTEEGGILAGKKRKVEDAKFVTKGNGQKATTTAATVGKNSIMAFFGKPVEKVVVPAPTKTTSRVMVWHEEKPVVAVSMDVVPEIMGDVVQGAKVRFS